MWFIGVEVEQETSAPPPKKNPGSAPENDIQLSRLKIVYLFTWAPSREATYNSNQISRECILPCINVAHL